MQRYSFWRAVCLLLVSLAAAVPAGSHRMVGAECRGTGWDEPQPVTVTATREKLAAGEPVTVVCLGDSVTGIYYHTGGLRAYPEMLQLALQTTYPQAHVTVRNAGISGNRTGDGLQRLAQDVLEHQPDLVTVMFGLNDLTVLTLADFRANLVELIQRCRAAGAEVLLCTPNSVLPTPARPVPKLAEYCAAIRQVADVEQVPLCDVYATYEAVHERDPRAWRLLLSDEIHPNMDGHKLTAETLSQAITGQCVSLREIGPPRPALPKTRSLVAAGQPVRVLAMEPLDQLTAPVFHAVLPGVTVDVQRWPTADQSLAQLEEAAKAVRSDPPDFVLIAVPAAVTPALDSASDASISTYSWILNWSLSFGRQEWDVVAVAPSVLTADPSSSDQAADAFACHLIRAQDLHLVTRPDDDHSPPGQIIENWLRAQWTADE